MLLWNARLVEWYYPALAHLQNVGIVDTANAIKVVEGLNDPRYSKARAQLALGARVVDRELVCPDCIASYLRRVMVRVEIKTSRRWRRRIRRSRRPPQSDERVKSSQTKCYLLSIIKRTQP